MLSPIRLCTIAFQGLGDLRAAAGEYASVDGPLLNRAYGSRPRTAVIALALSSGLIGTLIDLFAVGIPHAIGSLTIHWTILAGAVAFAIALRRVLFSLASPSAETFNALFAPLWIACAILVMVAGITGQIRVPMDASDDVDPLLLAVEILEAAAVFTLAIAALCYRKQWIRAATDLVIRLIVFKFMIWLAVLLMVDIGIVGKIVGGIIHGLTGWTLPANLKQWIDRLSYAGLVSVAYLAIIGGTWTVCKQTFAELVRTGDVDILATLHKRIHAKDEDVDNGNPETRRIDD